MAESIGIERGRAAAAGAAVAPESVETRASWVVASASLVIMSFCYGAPLVAVVALKPIAAELGSTRSVPALAYSLAWLGIALGGMPMGPLAERIGVRWTVVIGAASIALGLAIAAQSGMWGLLIGHGLFIGCLGIAGINAPLYIYVSRWFDRRRGTALALISSGQYIAGTLWPPLFERLIAAFGWRHAMMLAGIGIILLIVPLALVFLGAPPRTRLAVGKAGEAQPLALSPRTTLAVLSVASFCCCVPMAMPQGHIVALCTDLGFTPGLGAAMLSTLLGTAFVSRQVWGWISDRIGGLRTILLGSAVQAASISALMATHDEVALFGVVAVFGFGFSGIVPAWVLTIREHFPAREAPWRVPLVLLCTGSGMAAGGWLAGALYDGFASYGPAFATGLAFNLLNFALVGFLVSRRRRADAATG